MPVGVGVSGLESDGGDQQMTAHGFKGMASAIEMGCWNPWCRCPLTAKTGVRVP